MAKVESKGSSGNPVPTAQKKRRLRSPSYPAIGLEEALNRARTIWQHERKNSAPLDAVMNHWGYKSKSSNGLLAAAAMKKYGLLLYVDGTNGRHVRLSDLALNIILDHQEDSSERDASLKEAAMKPSLHQELWKKWGQELPSEATMRTYLLRDRGFSEESAAQALEVYRGTISFAGFKSGDIIQNDGGLDDEDESSANPPYTQSEPPKMQPSTMNSPTGKPAMPPFAIPTGQKDFPLYLSNNQRAVLYVPASMSKSDYELLKRQIDNHLAVIAATSIQEEAAKS